MRTSQAGIYIDIEHGVLKGCSQSGISQAEPLGAAADPGPHVPRAASLEPQPQPQLLLLQGEAEPPLANLVVVVVVGVVGVVGSRFDVSFDRLTIEALHVGSDDLVPRWPEALVLPVVVDEHVRCGNAGPTQEVAAMATRHGSAPAEEESDNNKKRKYASRTLRSNVRRKHATAPSVAATVGASSAGDEDTMVIHALRRRWKRQR